MSTIYANFSSSSTLSENQLTTLDSESVTSNYYTTTSAYQSDVIVTETSTAPDTTTWAPVDEAGYGPSTWDDATWILTSSFIIFTMQSGFGLLEAGAVNPKNEVNILVKNVVDVVFGGISYWMVGYGLSFGDSAGANSLYGVGRWFVSTSDNSEMGLLYSNFIFQLSFTTTATTIVSGAMAERTKLTSYMVFSFFNTLVYSVPAHWVWSDLGFLRQLGCIDIAGSGVVHMLGGSSALVAAILLKPRTGRYQDDNNASLGNPTNSLIGLFMLWWGWLAFNAGSTYGISGGKWKLASRSATTTILASMGGGVVGILVSHVVSKKILIPDIINSILGSLVGITASCAVVEPHEALIIGALGGLLCMSVPHLMDALHVDDPVGAFAVHGAGGVWGMLAVGLFVDVDLIEDMTMGRRGLFHSGGWYLLGVQALAIVVIVTWTVVSTLLMLLPLHFTVGLRMSAIDEELGSDFVEHDIRRDVVLGGKSATRAVSFDARDSPLVKSRQRQSAFGNRVTVRSKMASCDESGELETSPSVETMLDGLHCVNTESADSLHYHI